MSVNACLPALTSSSCARTTQHCFCSEKFEEQPNAIRSGFIASSGYQILLRKGCGQGFACSLFSSVEDFRLEERPGSSVGLQFR